MGSALSAKHTRESVVLQAKFLSGDLPYFAELLAEVSSQTRYSGELLVLLTGRRSWN